MKRKAENYWRARFARTFKNVGIFHGFSHTVMCALAQNVGIPTVISIREFSLYRGDSRGIAGNLNVTSFWQRRLRRKWIDMRRSWPRLARRPSKGPIAHTEMKCSFPRQKPNKALIFLYNLQRVNWEQKSWCVFSVSFENFFLLFLAKSRRYRH